MAAVAGDHFWISGVVKADGLAAGKGVWWLPIAAKPRRPFAPRWLDRVFGRRGRHAVIEECLSGPEVSFFALADGRRAISLRQRPRSQEHF